MEKTRPAGRMGSTALVGILILIVAVFGNHTVWAQTTTASAAAPAAPTATPAVATVEVEAAPEASNVQLIVGKSTLIEVGSPIARVSLTSADIADALVTSPSQLLLHGKVPGTISMFVWSRAGAVKRYEVAVQRDYSKLTEQLKQLFPNERIEVHANGAKVILSGTVSNKDVLDRAVNVAISFAATKDDVVSTLQVGQAGPSNQVLLRVRFAEVSRTALTEFGMSFFTSPTGIRNTVGRVTTQQYSAPNFSDLAWTKASSEFGSDVVSAEGKFAFSDFLNLFFLSEKYDLGTVIRAMQSRGLFQSLAEPNLVAQSGKEASFLAGGEFPVPVAQGSGTNIAITVMFKEFGIRLNFTPTVIGNRIQLKVRPEVSTLDFGNSVVLSGFRIPALTTRRTETELELRDGQTFAIAGLMNNKMQSTLQKVPGIGDIPILGHLFRSRAANKDQTELVVMITPEILSTNSDGVTRELPRLGEPYLAPLPQNRTRPNPPPAFRPGTGPGARNAPVPSREPTQEELAAIAKARMDAERSHEQANRAQADDDLKQLARDERARTDAERREIEDARKLAKQAEENARRMKEEQARQEKIAAEHAKKNAEAAARAQKEAARQAEINRKEQEKAAREQAKRDAAAARKQAEEAERASKNQKSDNDRDEERQRAIASAEAKLKAAEAAYQAQISKESQR